MNSINFNPLNNMNAPLVNTESASAVVQEAAPEVAGDSVDIGASATEATAQQAETAPVVYGGKNGMMRLRDIPKEIKRTNKPDQVLMDFAVQHPVGVGVAACVAATALGATGAVLIANAGNTIHEVIDLGKNAASMSGLKEKAQVFGQAASLIGAQAATGAAIGAAGMGGVAVFKGIEGTKNFVKGVKKHDRLKKARGLRKMNVGFKGALAAGTVASYGIMNKKGAVGTFRSTIMPGLQVATSVLNTSVGALQLAKGIKNKNKKDIIGGALNLGVGVACGVSLMMGGGIVATACTVFSVARDGFNAINDIKKLHNGVKEARTKKKAIKEAHAEAVSANIQAQSAPKAGGVKNADKAASANKAQDVAPVEQAKGTTQTASAQETRRQEPVVADNKATSTIDMQKLMDMASPENAIWVDG